MYQNSASFQARFHTARKDDKGLATSITTWRQRKVEAEAGDEEGAGGDDVETGHEDAAGDEGEAGDMKALVKGPCLVLVIERQPRWTNCVYVRYTGD